MAFRGALIVVLVCASAAHAQWYPNSRAAARAQTRHKINKDLFEIDALARELERALDPSAPGDLSKAAKQAGKIAKLAHDVWKSLQGGKASRPEPKLDPRPRPRPLASASTELAALRALLDEIRRGIAVQQRALTVDARLTLDLVEKLERLELSARRLEIDASGK